MEWWSLIPAGTLVVCAFGYLGKRQDIGYAKWLHREGYKDAEYRVAMLRGKRQGLRKPDDDDETPRAA